jgi:hypothetical protein
MKVSEAKDIARRWVRDNAIGVAGFRGALFAGSINFMADEATFPPSSDVDIWILQDGIDDWQNMDKVLVDGIILETVFRPSEKLLTKEDVLSDPFAACHFAASSVIEDSSGDLINYQKLISEEYVKREWILRRCDLLHKTALSRWLGMMTDSEDLLDQAAGLSYIIQHVALIPVIANLGSPTARKCLIKSKELLEAQDELALYSDMLRLLGSAAMSRNRAQSILQDYIHSFDRAVEVIQTPYFGDFDINNHARPIVIDGAIELIDGGYHREAMYYVLIIYGFCQRAIQNDAPEGEKQLYLEGYKRMLSELGLHSSEDFYKRAEFAEDVLDRCMQFAEKMIASN